MASSGVSQTVQQLLDSMPDGPWGTSSPAQAIRNLIASFAGVGTGPGGVQISPVFLHSASRE